MFIENFEKFRKLGRQLKTKVSTFTAMVNASREVLPHKRRRLCSVRPVLTFAKEV